jgi:hypothetical protein
MGTATDASQPSGPPDIEISLRDTGATGWKGSGTCRICPEQIFEQDEPVILAWYQKDRVKHGLA